MAGLLVVQMTGLYALGAYVFRLHALWLPCVAPTFAMVAAAFTNCAARSALAERDRSALRGQV
jgi:hypothetical protein